MKRKGYPRYMTQNEYIALNGQRCPRCFSEEIKTHGIEEPADATSLTILLQAMECKSCGAIWNDEYKLSRFHADESTWLHEDEGISE